MVHILVARGRAETISRGPNVRGTVGPVNRSRHVVSAIVLLGLGVFATWNVVHNGNWTDPVLPVVGGLAVIWWAGGLGLLGGTSVGMWLGRLGATVLLVVGVYLGWDNVVHPSGSTLYGDPLLIVVPLTALLVGAGIGMLVVLRPRADRHPTAGRPSGPQG